MSTIEKYGMNFLMGGMITITTSYLGTFVSPLKAALFWMMPWTLLPTIYFMSINKKSNRYIGKFLKATIYPLPIMIITLLGLGYFYIHSKSRDIWTPMLKGGAVWIGTSVIFYFIIEYLELEDKF